MSKSASLIPRYYSHLPHLCAAALPLFHLPRIAFLFIPNCQGLTQGLLQMPIPSEIFPDFALPEWNVSTSRSLSLEIMTII